MFEKIGLRAPSEESLEAEMWIVDYFQSVLKKLVCNFLEAENQLYPPQERMRRFESSKSDGKVPNSMKNTNVTVKGRNSEHIQPKFDVIIKEAELKHLEATIEVLHLEEQHFVDRCTAEKQNVITAIET